MGAHLTRRYLWDASVEPDPEKMPSFPPNYGLPERKERVMVATQQEMMDAQLTLQQRDYCAHYLIRLLKCKRDSFPNFVACKHEQHDWDYCEHQDYVKRMKEFERERRLLRRKKRRELREQRVAQGQGEGEVGPEMAL
ncbi:NADH dehydrogenase (ubiquinone) 1 beta subcomplex, 7 (predicted) [Rattus norvegicus]|uniref:NADH dehydrogenase [ubiquinone] 1 beta subcomplex subunit 7 n=2 Tax=Rattus norvegicus TaxID=10116 RepID=D3ZLT1_RAT|nr:NADH dehydrogenase [ubiquinone] 1 beta subcomplex subunit 7 [Rattus norvegicus]EDL92270.1 NADH dehydrogenase (ubiquinone) 1 beta subcomplex, 7 (predicted) [Rattus norvegicus]|eukprot:NP_001101912.1 NADH dehydrogenase [ubiquinone] 1 beta subcomplex subunit 7 [Rattus norvegicus]